MDHYSILDRSTPPQGAVPGTVELAGESDMSQMGAHQYPNGSISALMAAANGLSAVAATSTSWRRFAREEAGHSLAEMAQRDLDAALQLLAERAQYITGASGAAIALRRGSCADMLCRASSGPNAPELGALLSAEFGLSGESVRTRLPLRCDDTERDARVNREGCRRLRIASVAVMPIVSDDEVLGVFELFSGKVNAFGERDLSALHRLGEMVETAVRLAQTAGALTSEAVGEFVTEVSDVGPALQFEAAPTMPASPAKQAAAEVIEGTPADSPKSRAAEPPNPPTSAAAIPVKKPLLWSAASQPATKPPESDQSHVPPVLRNLRKCQACSFPVSEGRTLCVECEEKQWRGQLRAPATAASRPSAAANRTNTTLPVPSPVAKAAVATAAGKAFAERAVSLDPIQPERPAVEISAPLVGPSHSREKSGPSSALPEISQTSESTLPLLSAGVSSSESWLSANKYILGAIVTMAAVLGAIALLR